MTKDAVIMERTTEKNLLKGFTIQPAFGPKDEFCYYAIKNNEDKYIGSTWGTINQEESRKIAQLFAAGPDLLEVLQMFVEAFDAGESDDFNVRDAAEIAIKKATE